MRVGRERTPHDFYEHSFYGICDCHKTATRMNAVLMRESAAVFHTKFFGCTKWFATRIKIDQHKLQYLNHAAATLCMP